MNNSIKLKHIYKKIILTFLALLLISTTACGKKDNNLADADNNADNNTEASVSEDGVLEEESSVETADETAKKFLEGFNDIEKQSEELKNLINNEDLSQTDYNLKTGDLYTLWDNTLNDLWNVLSKTLSKDEMDSLTEEENAWIADKEKQVADAGSEVEGGSMQPMVENMKGAALTEARVRELVMLLPGATDYIDVTGTEYEDGNPGMDNGIADNNNDESDDLFNNFLYNGGNIRIADNIVQNNVMLFNDYHPITEFTFDELKAYVIDNSDMGLSEPSEISYTKLNNPNRKAYILSLKYETQGEPFTQYYIMSVNNSKLDINYTIDGWSRRYPAFNEYGVVFDGGSNGAGSHSSTIIVPTDNFEYKELVSEDYNAAGWNFYDVNTGEKSVPISDIMAEAFDSGREDISDVLYTQMIVNGTKYYYYLKEGITQDMVNYIDGIADKYDFTFDGKDKADAAVEAYARELGVEELYKDERFVDWIDY